MKNNKLCIYNSYRLGQYNDKTCNFMAYLLLYNYKIDLLDTYLIKITLIKFQEPPINHNDNNLILLNL